MTVLVGTLMAPLASTSAWAGTEMAAVPLAALQPAAIGLVRQDFWCWTRELAKGFGTGAVVGFVGTIEVGGAGAVLGAAGGVVTAAINAKDKC